MKAKRGTPYILTGAKQTRILKALRSNEIFCFKCEEPITIGQTIQSGCTNSARWYHYECFEKTRQ